MVAVCLFKGKDYELAVDVLDYLRILQGGNFINFTCMATDHDNKKSVVDTENFRLKVMNVATCKLSGLRSGGLQLDQ